MKKSPHALPVGLALLVLGLLAGPGREASARDEADPRGEEQSLRIPAGLPEQFRTELSHQGARIRLELTKKSQRGPNFEVYLQLPDGSYAPISPPPVTTYQGYVVERPTVKVSAVLAEGLRATVHETIGPELEIQPPAPGRAHLVSRARLSDEPGPRCLSGEAGVPEPTGESAESGVDSIGFASARGAVSGCNVKQAELGIDASSEYYLDLGASVESVLAAIEASVNAMNTIYVRDARIEYLLGRVVIRTSELSDPYYGYDRTYPEGVSELIARVEHEWNVNQATSQHDVAQLVTTRLGGGAARNASICNSDGYGVSDAWGNVDPGRFDQIMRHELGHQWSAAHYEGGSPEGPTVMSGNAISRFSAPELEKIEAFRDTRECLTDAGPSLSSVAPYGRLDTKAGGSEASSLLIDVLANDHDANCDALSIAGVDSSTSRGGTAELSPGTGPGGRDEILYRPNPLAGPGPDSWSYLVSDGTDSVAGNIIVYPGDAMSGDNDSFIQSNRPTTNYGNRRVLRVRGSRTAVAARAMFRFDLSAFPADVHVDSASLEFFVIKFRRKGSGWMSLHRILSGWTEGSGLSGEGVSWNLRGQWQDWSSAGGDFDPSSSVETSIHPTGGAVFRMDVTADVARMVAGEIPNYGWLLKHSDESNTANLAVASRRSRRVEWHPRLVVVTSPGAEP